jgi:hypothetical protein
MASNDEEAFATYSPFIPNHRTQMTDWVSNGCQGEFLLNSISVRVPSPFTNLSDYYRSLMGRLLVDFFASIDNMFPDFKLGYRYNGTELSFYLTKS